MKSLTRLSFLLWFAPLVALQASHNSSWHFWRNMQLQAAFSIKADRYQVYMNRTHPGRQNGEMECNDDPTDETTKQCYLIRWYHAPSIFFERDTTKDELQQSDYDPQGIFGFTGNGMTLAAELLIAKDFRRLRISGGGGIRCSFLKKMIGQWVNNSQLDGDPNYGSNPLNAYIPPHPYYFTWTPLIRIGINLIENQDYTLLIDGTFAPCIYRFSEFDKSSYWIYLHNGDLGGTWEKQLTRYVNWNLRVAYGFCLNNEILQSSAPSSSDDLLYVSHYIHGIIAQIGISIRIPGLSQCPIVECRTSLDHTHGGKDYKGN